MRALRQVAPGTAGNLGGDRLARAIDYPLLVLAGWDPATQTLAPDREHPLLGYPVCRSPAASWRRGTRAVCAPDAVIAFVRAAEPTPGPSARPASAGRTVRVTGGAWSAGSPASSVPSGPAICA